MAFALLRNDQFCIGCLLDHEECMGSMRIYIDNGLHLVSDSDDYPDFDSDSD